MICTRELKVAALVLIQVHVSFGRKSTEKCNEYIHLSSEFFQADTSAVINLEKVPTMPGEFPHLARLFYKDDDARCGGTLISDQYILTSAVCASGSPALGPFEKVSLGGYKTKLSTDAADVQEFGISDIIIHPEYIALYNDIALLKLDQKVKFTKNVRPACLQTEENLNTDTVIGAGWGIADNDGNTSDELFKVQMKVFSNVECNKHYEEFDFLKYFITENMLCTGGRTQRNGTCLDNSGGPVQILRSNNSNIYNIVGVISLGSSKCGLVNEPEIATRVSSYVSWIENIVFP